MKSRLFGLLTVMVFLGYDSFSQSFTTADYKKACWMTTRSYGGQRSSEKNGGPYNWIVMNNGSGKDFTTDADNGYDLTGGWFDCGDHVKFGQTQFYSGYMLLKGYDLWPAGYGDYYSQNYAGYFKAQDFTWEGNKHDPDGIPDILNEVKYATDFFIKCSRDANTFYYQIGEGNADHKHWVTSVKMATLGTGEGGSPRPVYKNPADASMPSFCGATLALMSRKYRPIDAKYADTCLAHALYCYTYAKAHPGSVGCAGGTFYGANAKWQDDFATLCTELYYATNDAKYKTEALSYENNLSNHNYCFGYNDDDDIAAYNLATLGSSKSAALLKTFATTYKAAVTNGIYNGGNTTWGPLRYNANAAFIVAANDLLNGVTTIDPFIYKQIDFIMGNNTQGSGSSKLSFIVGFGSNAAKYPHHRNIYLNDNDVANTAVINIPTRNAQHGYLVGGVRSGTFTDSRNNYQTTEGGIDYSACLVGTLAYILSKTAVVNPTSMALAPKPLSVPLAGKVALTVTYQPAGASSTLTWTSRNSAIATVNANGEVTGVAVGSTYIVAKAGSGNVQDSVLCNVVKINVTGVTVTPTSLPLTIGNTGQLNALTVPSNASNQSVTWSSSNPSVATVSASGLVSAVATGTVTITATTEEGGFTASASVTVSENTSMVIANQISTPPTIDGNLDESFWILNKTITKTVSGTNNNTSTFGVYWDANNLYIGVKVLDATISTNNTNVYDKDGVEFYFDMNNDGGAFGTVDRQWVKVVNATNIWEKIGTAAGANTTTSKVVSATKTITGGYTIEMAIPWSTSLGTTPSTSVLYGFDLAINDCDGGTARSAQTMWMGDANDYQNLSNVGDLKLLAAPTTATQQIQLTQGWNLVSFNVIPSDSSITAVFSTVMNNLIEIKSADAFYSTVNGNTQFNLLKIIQQGKAYLVKMKNSANVSVTGTPSTITSAQLLSSLKTGWNMVGCPYQTNTAIATAIDVTKVTAIKNFEGFFINGGTNNSLSSMNPGKGYFIKK